MKKHFSKGFISLADVYIAYRKSKAEAFYDGSHPNTLSFANFEEDLRQNLQCICADINSRSPKWMSNHRYLGGYAYVPKSIDERAWRDVNSVHRQAIDPIEQWRQSYDASGCRKVSASYRLIIRPTVAFQVISALWILKVGHLFEAKLDPDLSFGNRIRRYKLSTVDAHAVAGPPNPECAGLFVPYFSAYQSWRQKGLDCMRESVGSGTDVTAVTMDLAGFYHNVCPQFLLRPSFLATLGIELSADERLLTSQLIQAMSTWYRRTPDAKARPEGALPVGLSASKVISNVLLFELDQQVSSQLKPLYYGRYVDDIFLVVNTPDSAATGADVMRWLAGSVGCLRLKREKGLPAYLRLRFGYALDSDLYFTADKQKIFVLSSNHGLDLVDRIAAQIRRQSSEYRLLPEVPDSSAEMAVETLVSNPRDASVPDSLRKADSVSVRRLGFALLLKDIETYSRDLRRDAWTELRHEFYGLVQRHLLSPHGLFELHRYYGRVFGLMISNFDFRAAKEFVDGIIEVLALIEETSKAERGSAKKKRACRQFMEAALVDAAVKASTTRGFNEWTNLGRLLRMVLQSSENLAIGTRKPQLEKLSRQILLADLGSRPYKDFWYYEQSEDLRSRDFPRNREIRNVVRWLDIKAFRQLVRLPGPHWPALAFSTRPMSVQEIVLVAPTLLSEPALFRRCIKGLRGAGVIDTGNIGFLEDGDRICHIPTEQPPKVVVAITNIETTDEQCRDAVRGAPDRSLARYKNLCAVLNNVLRDPTTPQYILLPELSIPRRWAIGIASKLGRQGISFVAGIEYYREAGKRNVLRNDALVSLSTSWPGYKSSIIYLQAKLKPAHGERRQLARHGYRLAKPASSLPMAPIYDHGGYYFGVVICSDLTAISNRSCFQGKVDSLVVLEWNPDVDTFGFLVESAAHDVHAYIVQVNNRRYGDSRIRAPYRERYLRDAVRIKGGISDYAIIGEIDFLALRRFQKSKAATNSNGLFKPVPIGFSLSRYRKNTRI